MTLDDRLRALPVGTLTPVLNAAFGLLLTNNEKTTGALRRRFSYWRLSWGNWSPCATEKSRFTEDLPDKGQSRNDLFYSLGRELAAQKARAIFIGQGPCPWCKQIVGLQTAEKRIHRNFRWHVLCIARAYAQDANQLGNDREKKWASEVLGPDGHRAISGGIQ